MEEEYNLPLSFYFKFSFVEDLDNNENVFKEASGFFKDIRKIEEGKNSYYEFLNPIAENHNLVLKRGVALKDDKLIDWCSNALDTNNPIPIKSKAINISFFDKEEEQMTWVFFNAFPVKWSIASNQDNTDMIVIETVEFSYSHFSETLIRQNF